MGSAPLLLTAIVCLAGLAGGTPFAVRSALSLQRERQRFEEV